MNVEVRGRATVGESVLLSIRAEALRIVNGEAGCEGCFLGKAVVSDIAYLGGNYEVVLNLAQSRVRLACPELDELAIGQSVQLAVKPGSSTLLAADRD